MLMRVKYINTIHLTYTYIYIYSFDDIFIETYVPNKTYLLFIIMGNNTRL